MTESTPVRPLRRIGVALIVLAALSTVSGVIVTVREHQQIECQAGVNGALSKALRERSDAASKERQAQLALFSALLDPGATPESRRAALATYYEQYKAADSARDANPLPDASTCQ
ncbi:hypothetical protein GCM10010174_61830 [Kutzneria viridogrisea]|uniref:Uncharacterized protein n=1 Tax=Kutzneria viridogrisea TaxID=47990 RepID=A0ABR6BG91_9PSEU|nr:hypothetical protein [Kutzneria viridogrisea]